MIDKLLMSILYVFGFSMGYAIIVMIICLIMMKGN